MFIEKISKKYNDKKIISKLSMKIAENKKTCLFGKSGCGKTTLINIICGLEKLDDGKIIFEINVVAIPLALDDGLRPQN